jgi:hypothetical protein
MAEPKMSQKAIELFNKEYCLDSKGATHVVETVGISQAYDSCFKQWYLVYGIEYCGQKCAGYLPFIEGFLISCDIITKDFIQLRIANRTPLEVKEGSIRKEVNIYRSEKKEYILAYQAEGEVLPAKESFLVSVTQLVTEEQLNLLRKMEEKSAVIIKSVQKLLVYSINVYRP